jgi:hypothetical protein
MSDGPHAPVDRDRESGAPVAALFRFQSREGASTVVFGEPGDAALLGVVTLEEIGLILDPIRRELRPMPMSLIPLSRAERKSDRGTRADDATNHLTSSRSDIRKSTPTCASASERGSGGNLGRNRAERGGFEPPEAEASHDFESCRFNRAHAPLRGVVVARMNAFSYRG